MHAQVPAGKQRLSREDWLDFGLTVLRDEGPQALKAEPLCKRLGVSRGSFYWHFDSAGVFMLAVVARWEARATEQVILAVQQCAGGAAEQLRFLLRKVGELDVRLYEAIHSLEAQLPELTGVLRRVHERRLGFLADLLVARGLAPDEAALRARMTYAWAMGELLTRDPLQQAYTEAQIDAVERLMLRP